MPTTQRIKKKSSYTLKIIDETSLDTVFSMNLSRGKIYTFLSTLFVVSVVITVCVLIFTPLKYYIPGYGSNKTRMQTIQLKKDYDSISKMVIEQQAYAENIRNIINGSYNGVKDTTKLDMKKVKSEDMNSIIPKPAEIKKEATTQLKRQAKEHEKKR